MEKQVTFKLSEEEKKTLNGAYNIFRQIHSIYHDLVVDDEVIENGKVESAMELIGLLEIANEITYK